MSQIITLTQHVPAAPEKVWEAFTTVDGLAAWWWPFAPDTTYELNLFEGGPYEIRAASREIGVRGQFHTLEHAQAINMTWIWEGDSDPDAVRIEMEPQDGGTLVTVKHSVREDGDCESLRQGWSDVLERLGRITDETSFPAYTPAPVNPPMVAAGAAAMPGATAPADTETDGETDGGDAAPAARSAEAQAGEGLEGLDVPPAGGGDDVSR